MGFRELFLPEVIEEVEMSEWVEQANVYKRELAADLTHCLDECTKQLEKKQYASGALREIRMFFCRLMSELDESEERKSVE